MNRNPAGIINIADSAGSDVLDNFPTSGLFSNVFDQDTCTVSCPIFLSFSRTTIGVLGRTANIQFLNGQIHSVKLTDPFDAGNNLNMNFAIRSVEMPTETNIYDQFGAVVGTWNNLDGSDPYTPLLIE